MTEARRGARAPLRRFVSLCIAALVAVGLGAGAVGAQSSESTGVPSLSAARVTGQIVGGTVVAPVAFIGGGILTKRIALKLGADDEKAGKVAYVGAYTSTWLATAAVPALIGRDGRFPAALGGSALGMLASLGVAKIGNWRYDGDRRACDILCWTLGAVVVALPSVGATVLYDQSRR